MSICTEKISQWPAAAGSADLLVGYLMYDVTSATESQCCLTTAGDTLLIVLTCKGGK